VALAARVAMRRVLQMRAMAVRVALAAVALMARRVTLVLSQAQMATMAEQVALEATAEPAEPAA